MNDTFDNCTFSNFDNYVLDVSNVKNATKGSLELEKSQSVTKSDVSFDDSLFLNTQLLTLLKDNEDSCSQAICNGNNPPLENKAAKLSQNCKNGDLSEEKDCHPEVRNTNDSLQDDMFNEPPSTIPKSRDCINGDDLFNQTAPNASPPTLPKSCASSSRQLSSWGLPRSILEKYAARKISTMFPWQVECLNNPKILKHHANLVYSAPTSAGKTLVAEILAIKTVLERRKKVLFILPFVSVVREKMFYFQDIFSGSGVRVEGFMGSYNPPGGFQSVQFAVCTIEKANSLVNNFLQEGSLGEIGAVIIDEMHLLGEPNRGYLLELLLTKLRYVSLRDDHVDMQIIGMSATLPNLGVLAKWLDAELYVTDFRPIPLYEQAQICGALYDNKFNLIRRLSPLPELETDTDNILQLCIETISANCSVLIFCPTKNWCENLAQQIASAFLRLGSGKSNKVGNDISNIGQELRRQLKPEPIGEVLEQLRFCPVGLDGVLRKTVSFGVAFHHAGLTLDERDIVEAAFRNGVVRVLVATSTLSSGVNLPARRVIIRSPLAHGKPLDSLTYRQMIGRAGRMGKDTSGESILVCQKNDEQIARSLMCQQLRPIESCLEEGKLKRAILEIVASGVASSPRDVELFTKCTLLAQSDNFDSPIKEALEFLVTNEFLRLQDGTGQYVATSLGRACLSSSIPPEDGLSLFTELEKARQCFVLETELHLIYLVTPYSACHQWGNLDWMFYLNLWEKLPASMRKVGELVGVRESYIVGATRGKPQTNTSKLYHKYLVHKRFFVALALQDLVNERPLSEVCAKFSCNRGMLQSLQLTASTFAGMVTSFSRQLGWSSVEILISQFQDRLHFGVSRDLLDLMRLPILNGKSARALYDGGLQTVIQLANSEVGTIESVLSKVVPFESGKMRDGESEFGLKERNKFRNIWITGREGLTEREAAEVLLTSAREFLRVEMGLKEAKWNNSGSTSGNEELSTEGEEQKADCGGASSPLGAENGEQKDDVKLNDSVSGGVSSPVGVENRNGCKSIPDLIVSNGELKSLNISDSSDIFSPLNSSVSRVGGKGFKEQLNVSGISDVFSPLRQQNSHTNPNVTSDGSLFETSIGETPSRLNTATRNTSRTSLNSSGDFVTTSQDESYFSFRENTPRVSRKRPKTGKENRFLLQMQSPRKKKKISNESSLNEIETVDVCSHDELFKVFCGEAKREEMISLAVVCSPREEKTKTIGLTPDPGLDTRDKFVYKSRKVDGFAMFWGGSTTYYLDLSKMEKCVDFVKLLLSNKHLTVTMFDCKEQIKVLKRCCEVEFCARTEDPKVGVWLLEPEGREKSFQEMVIQKKSRNSCS
jgi:replicative superfamily II helicase